MPKTNLRNRAIPKAFLLLFLVGFTAPLPATAAVSKWQADINMGAQGLQGAYAFIDQDSYRLDVSCSIKQDQNHDIYISLKVPPTSSLQPGTGTMAHLTLSYGFKAGTVSQTRFTAKYTDYDAPSGVWAGYIPFDSAFMRNFSKSRKLSIIDPDNKTVFTFSMKGSAAATAVLKENCYDMND
ncbi:MAG: hypothetical protein QM492_09295 [Rhodobacterales bacterium]